MVRLDNSDLLEAIEESRRLLEAMTTGDFVPPGQMVQTREDQVRNNAGGFVFRVDDLARIRRFLILGTSGGTYYVQEQELTIQNVAALIEIIRKGKGGLILREIVDISLAGRAPKQDPLLFALALCARYNVQERKHKKGAAKGAENAKSDDNEEGEGENEGGEENNEFNEYIYKLQQTAFKAVDKVCRIPTHLFSFVKFCEIVATQTGDKKPTGWGRAMRKCVAEWYLQRSPKDLAMHITKYRNRAGYTHRDLLRLAHPVARRNNKSSAWPNELTLVYDQLFHYACTGELDAEKGNLPPPVEGDDGQVPQLKKARCDYALDPQMVQAAADSEALKFIRAVMEAAKLKKDDEQGEARCVELIREFRLVREHIPTDLLNSPSIWVALLEHMPITALIRNLSKLSAIGLIDGQKTENEKYVDMVVSKILDQEAIHRARIHPISVLLAASVYEQGHGQKGSLDWEVNERVKEALDKCFILAFHNVQPTNRRFCLALDVSGSMTSPVLGGTLSCRTAAAAMAAVFLRTEKEVECVAFQDALIPLPFTRESEITEMCDYVNGIDFGRTDCALPMVWAAENKKKFDVFIVFTDSETYFGDIHPFEAMQKYREKMGVPGAKLAVMGMTSTDFTIADPNDPGMMDICGLDSAVPELLRAFVLDEI